MALLAPGKSRSMLTGKTQESGAPEVPNQGLDLRTAEITGIGQASAALDRDAPGIGTVLAMQAAHEALELRGELAFLGGVLAGGVSGHDAHGIDPGAEFHLIEIDLPLLEEGGQA